MKTFLKEDYKVALKKISEENSGKSRANTACKNCVSMINANREMLSLKRKRQRHEQEVPNVVHLRESEHRVSREKIRKVHKSTGLKNASNVLKKLRRTKTYG